jgi:AcrR family transcriptional regulator
VTTPQVTTRRRPGRPRATGGDSALDPRDEILRHAAALFSAKGVGATRVSDIAASVGVSAPAIYYHFDNVDAIVEQLLAYVVDESAAFATAAARGDGPPADRLRSLVKQHVERLTAGPYDLWFVAGLSDAERARFPGVSQQAARWRRSVRRLAREAAERGDFRPIDPRLAVAAVSGLVYGALELRHRGARIDAAGVAEVAVSALAATPGR